MKSLWFIRYFVSIVIAPTCPLQSPHVCLLLTAFPFFSLAVASAHIPQLGTGDFSNSSVSLIEGMWLLNQATSPVGASKKHVYSKFLRQILNVSHGCSSASDYHSTSDCITLPMLPHMQNSLTNMELIVTLCWKSQLRKRNSTFSVSVFLGTFNWLNLTLVPDNNSNNYKGSDNLVVKQPPINKLKACCKRKWHFELEALLLLWTRSSIFPLEKTV